MAVKHGLMFIAHFLYLAQKIENKGICMVKPNGLKQMCCSVDLENHIFPNIFIFKTCHILIQKTVSI